MHSFKNISIVSYAENIIDIAAETIIQDHQIKLPYLNNIIIFVPNLLTQNNIRTSLIKHANKYNFDSIFLPTITTLKSWVLSQHENDKPFLSEYARELILVDALQNHMHLFGNIHPWSMSNELLSLFDALQLNNSKADFFNESTSSYLIGSPLSAEAELVSILWESWKKQIDNENYLDEIRVYSELLNTLIISKDKESYCIGINYLSNSEMYFLSESIKNNSFFIQASSKLLATKPDQIVSKFIDNQSTIYAQGYSDNSPFTQFINCVLENSNKDIHSRAIEFADKFPTSPARDKISIIKINNFESHAKAIDLQIRIWMNEFKTSNSIQPYSNFNIGVVSADRKLIRRVRARLDHANINVNDIGGWALSTTSAALNIENWLQIIEGNFSTKAILSLMKSPFFPMTVDENIHSEATILLEKDIVIKNNIFNGIDNVTSCVAKYTNKYEKYESSICEYLLSVLDKFEENTKQLSILKRRKSAPLHEYISTLLNSFKVFGFYSTFNNDEAGKQIINLLETQYSQLVIINNEITWYEWRNYLSKILDQQNFKPELSMSNVIFCSIEQSRLQKFDRLIVASVGQDHFPGYPNNYIFFNQQIRSELGTQSWKDKYLSYLHIFRNLLEAAPHILLTAQTEENNEIKKICPWIEVLETFHQIAYNSDLNQNYLQQLVNTHDADIHFDNLQSLPAITTQASPVLKNEVKPISITTSKYQNLMNCAYQFFISTCLDLETTEKLEVEMTKADFGKFVHECVTAFYKDIKHLPGPFQDKVRPQNQEQAIQLLKSISKQIFHKKYTYRTHNSLWLERWLQLIPKFVAWDIKRQSEYIPAEFECSRSITVNPSLELKGRLDRIDRTSDSYGVIDYKTGQTPTKKSILAGEETQLPSYALIQNNCAQVEFVNIGKDNSVKSESIIKDDELNTITHQHKLRLIEFSKALTKEAKFIAQADDETCSKCYARVLCRKDYWVS